jgi:monoamine oxidase
MAEVVVVGAGAAGIAAATTLRETGIDCVVLEASDRVGGRARTEAVAPGEPFDHGASWLHEADDNPLTPLARRLGFTLRDEGRRRRDILLTAGHNATPAEQAAHAAACEAFDAAAEARAASGGPDVPLADAVPHDGPWDATAAHWYATIISGAEAGRISLADYVATGLGGTNLAVAEGLGRLVARLAEGLPVRLDTPVSRIVWTDGGVRVEHPGGTVQARGCIVTVSTGVLAADGIGFAPALPEAVRAAIDGLPQGLLAKVMLRAAGSDRLDQPAFARLARQVEGPGDTPMSWMLWPFGRAHAIGFIGGERAWALARQGRAAAEAFARSELARYFGAARVASAFAPGAVVTRWAEDTLFRGAYSIARPGHAGARAVLAEAALADGRLRFAGEACHTRYAGTVGGAWDSGVQAARAVVATLRGMSVARLR